MPDNIDFYIAKSALEKARQKQKEARLLLAIAQEHYDKIKKELENKES